MVQRYPEVWHTQPAGSYVGARHFVVVEVLQEDLGGAVRRIDFQGAGRAGGGGRQSGIQVGWPAAAEKRPPWRIIGRLKHLS